MSGTYAKKTDVSLHRIRTARELKGWSRGDLARRMGIGEDVVGQYEDYNGGSLTIQGSKVTEFARALDTEPLWLIGSNAGKALGLAQMMKNEGLDMYDVANKADVSYMTVKNYLSGPDKGIDLVTAQKIAESMSLSVWEMLNGWDGSKWIWTDVPPYRDWSGPKNDDGKRTYGRFDNVRLTEAEYNELNEKHPGLADRFIDKLSCYKASKGIGYNNDFGAMSNWVIREVEKEVRQEENARLEHECKRAELLKLQADPKPEKTKKSDLTPLGAVRLTIKAAALKAAKKILNQKDE